MKRLILILVALTCSGAAAFAQSEGSSLRSLDSLQDSQGWDAVGRLDIAGSGFCTAALIRDELLLTAAHCVYDLLGDVIPADRFTFQAGLKNGRADATRRISRLVAHPDYTPNGPNGTLHGVANDIAVLELDQPIRRTRMQPFAISDQPGRGDEVAIVSYGRDRSEAPSLQESCTILSHQNGALVMNCEAEFGSSGAPVFQTKDGQTRIVSVVSAIAQAGSNEVSLGTSLQEPLQELLDHFATSRATNPGTGSGAMSLSERNTTGAKFVRP